MSAPGDRHERAVAATADRGAPERIVGDGRDRSTIDVAVNLLWCVPGLVGGSEEYLARQLVGLVDRSGVAGEPPIRPTLHVVEGFGRAHPELARRVEVVEAPIDGVDRRRRIVAEHTWLARRTASADVVHHGGGTTPLRGRRPIVLTIHDVQHETFPGYLSRVKLAYLRALIPRSIARASVVAVPTAYVRGTLVERYGVDPDDVVVVPHGVGVELGADAPPAERLRAAHGLGDGPVLVYPAITHPHKGHVFLLEEMARSWHDPDLRLVLLGGAGAAEADVAAAIERLGLADRVVRPGRVPDAERDGLVALADALVVPSEYEGFGAPAVEAMALGTPVACSDHPALREVVGDAGLVRPLEPGAWADVPERAVASREALVRAGAARARAFTLEASGAALAGAYRRAAAR